MRTWNGYGAYPSAAWKERPSRFDLARTNEESQAATGLDQSGCAGQDGRETLGGTQGHDIEPGGLKGFGANALYIDVRQCERAHDLAKED